MSIKAIIFGLITTTVILLGGQLGYVLLASYIGSAATAHPLIHDNKDLLWFCLSAGAYAISFVLGGMLTAVLADKNKIIHAASVGFLVASCSLLAAGDLSILNYKAAVMVIAGLGFASVGGFICLNPEDN